MKTNELRAQRAKLVNDWRVILDKAQADKRALSGEEREQVSKIEGDIDALKATIDAQERLDAEERAVVPESQRVVPAEAVAAGPSKADSYRTAFWSTMRSNVIAPELRDHAVTTDSLGGYLVPDEFRRELIAALSEANIMRSMATVITTSNGTLSIPVNSAHGSASWLAEEGAYTTSDETFAAVTLTPYKASTLVKVSEELLTDSAFNLEGFLATELGRRIGELEEAAFVNGDGSAKPTGVVGGSTLGKTATATNAVTADELMDLFYSLGRAYRTRAAWLMNDSSVKAIRKMVTGVSGDKTYLWAPGLQAGEPDTLLGRPVYASGSMPTIATGNKAILFGDFSYYYIADRSAITMQRLNELYAGNGQVGFRQNKRTDGKLTLATAVQHLKLA